MEREDSAEIRYERRRDGIVAAGTFACPHCDAPVAPERRMRLGERVICPFCAHAGPVRAFLSLETPTRPAHVVVRIRSRSGSARPALR